MAAVRVRVCQPISLRVSLADNSIPDAKHPGAMRLEGKHLHHTKHVSGAHHTVINFGSQRGDLR